MSVTTVNETEILCTGTKEQALKTILMYGFREAWNLVNIGLVSAHITDDLMEELERESDWALDQLEEKTDYLYDLEELPSGQWVFTRTKI